ncbi:MAG: hypothetical protein JSW58_07310 [Candidatus Latescibacterota bacterium]|nr:MAG: hypothetical protein JSW58_07310 [Candidatus Latescibacterota bacterium]
MKKDFDIEELLMRFKSEPSARVKRSVLTRFGRVFGGRGLRTDETSFWRRPIPLYLAAANIVIAITLSFFAGQTMPLSERERDVLREPPQETSETVAPEVHWEIAPNDLI